MAVSRKTFQWLPIRAFSSLVSIERGFMGIASLALTFPLGNPSRFEFGRSVVAACPDYVDAAR